jgi:hypothetical protein
MKRLVTFVALALYAGTSMNAQTTGSATIVGTVTDTTGAVVPGVKINVVNTETQNPYLNASAFAYPAPFNAGTLGRNTLTGPGLVWAQTSLSKTFKFRERMRLSDPLGPEQSIQADQLPGSESRVQRCHAEHVRPLQSRSDARQLQ